MFGIASAKFIDRQFMEKHERSDAVRHPWVPVKATGKLGELVAEVGVWIAIAYAVYSPSRYKRQVLTAMVREGQAAGVPVLL